MATDGQNKVRFFDKTILTQPIFQIPPQHILINLNKITSLIILLALVANIIELMVLQ
jgi:hypothetical protein